MDEYIKREEAIEAAIDAADEWDGGYNLNRAAQIREGINYLPAADVKPVVHGIWHERPFLLGTSRFCSLCGSNYGMPHEIYNYCPNCGADMRGE